MNEDTFYRHNSLFSRRDFLRLTKRGCAGMGMTAAANTLLHQKLLAAVSADGDLNASEEYKALVCVFLFGGNDGMNCFLPTTNFSDYTRDRNEVALNRADLHDSTTLPGYAFHPSLPFFRDAFDAGNLAVVGNVGTLVEPVTRAEFENPRSGKLVPPQLFSHNNQQTQWQTSLPGEDSSSGWGGRIGDAARFFNDAARVSVSVSVGRSNIFSVGNRITRLEFGGGAVSLTNKGPSGLLQASQNLRDLQKSHIFRQEFANITDRSIESEILLRSIIDNGPTADQVGGAFQEQPGNILFQQLRSVSQMINAREELGVKRQIFFVHYHGFDNHGNQLVGHAEPLGYVNRALELFCQQIDSLGLANNVTTFTTTEFGRTYTSNANGTDHGWGNNQFVLGGAVKGGQIHGSLPDFELDGDQDTGFGRWIPGTSTDEYAATLAKWFGVAESDIATVVPNITRFDNSDVGFMDPA
jgi:uncharacterized protein (DUF1501 family)